MRQGGGHTCRVLDLANKELALGQCALNRMEMDLQSIGDLCVVNSVANLPVFPLSRNLPALPNSQSFSGDSGGKPWHDGRVIEGASGRRGPNWYQVPQSPGQGSGLVPLAGQLLSLWVRQGQQRGRCIWHMAYGIWHNGIMIIMIRTPWVTQEQRPVPGQRFGPAGRHEPWTRAGRGRSACLAH